MRRIALATIVVATSVLLSGCLHGDDDDDRQPGTSATRQASANEKGAVYFGWLLGTDEPAGVVIWAKEGLGKRGKISAYACDGVGPRRGWRCGSAES